MKILIPTIGTRGDVQPYIGLSLGLTKAGHTVTLASHPCMRALVESYGVSFAPMGPDIDIAEETAIIRRNSPHWMIGFMRVMNFSFSMLEKAHQDLLDLCRGVDLVIVSHTAAGFKAGIPALVIPHIIDQFIWGNKVFGLGVGPKPIPRDKLTVENMSAALIAMQNQEMKDKAALLGEAICAEPEGVGVAVEMITQSLK